MPQISEILEDSNLLRGIAARPNKTRPRISPRLRLKILTSNPRLGHKPSYYVLHPRMQLSKFLVVDTSEDCENVLNEVFTTIMGKTGDAPNDERLEVKATVI